MPTPHPGDHRLSQGASFAEAETLLRRHLASNKQATTSSWSFLASIYQAQLEKICGTGRLPARPGHSLKAGPEAPLNHISPAQIAN